MQAVWGTVGWQTCQTARNTDKPYQKKSDGIQLSLFDNENIEKLEKLDRAMDSIREKYGSDAVRRASFLDKSNPGKGR